MTIDANGGALGAGGASRLPRDKTRVALGNDDVTVTQRYRHLIMNASGSQYLEKVYKKKKEDDEVQFTFIQRTKPIQSTTDYNNMTSGEPKYATFVFKAYTILICLPS